MAGTNLSPWRIAAFCTPAIPISALGLPLVVHLPNFYAAEIGVSAAVVGLVMMALRFWDVFTDPVLGAAGDRYQSRWGRRRHWIVISVPIIMISVFFLFMPMKDVGASYLAGWLFILYVGWTLITISHMSWGAELSPDYHERSSIQGWREFALVAGSIAVLGVPSLLEAFMDEVSRGMAMQAMGVFVLILLPLTVGLAVSTVGERPAPPKEPIHWEKAWKAIRTNRPLRLLLAADFLQASATAITATLYFWFVPLVLGLPAQANTLLLIYFVSGVAGVPLWIRISHRFGKHKTFSSAMVYGAAVLPILFFLPQGWYWLAAFGFVLYGVAYGASSFLLRSMMADITDHDELETGQKKTGLFYALLSMTSKVGYAIAAGVTLPIIELIGISTVSPESNTPGALFALKCLYILPPAALFGLSAWMMWRYPLDQNAQEELRAGLEATNSYSPEVNSAASPAPSAAAKSGKPLNSPAE